MPKVVGVRFGTSPRVYYFSPAEDETYDKGDKVIVETQRGVEIAAVVQPIHDVEESAVVAPLKPITRKATEEDIQAAYMSEEQKRDILRTAKEKVSARSLDMKVVDCEFTADRGKLVLYFTAEQRVDFRELVRDLASAFHMRIDLRQIGARDECKIIGTLSPCGMPCCCGRFESDSEHVSIKMAKNQNLALTPNKINGMCGRLLCCLSYENKTYEDIMRRMPKHGAAVVANDGRRGSVVSVTPLSERVRVRFGDDESFEFAELPLSELTVLRGRSDDGENPTAPKNNGERARNDRGNEARNDRRKDGNADKGKGDKPRGERNGEAQSERKQGPRNDAEKNNGNGNNGNNRSKHRNRHRSRGGDKKGGGNAPDKPKGGEGAN